MKLEKVIETYGIDREDLEGNDWYIVKASDHFPRQVIGDLCIKAEDCISANKYNNCYEYDNTNTMYKTYYFKPKNQKDYIVINCQKNYLESQVRIRLQEGYEPLGGVYMIERTCFSGEKYISFSQAMYRKGDSNGIQIFSSKNR